jgi:catechol 2,3-dioxygenase-like lactoylglutathione lyase family enzyme
LAIDVKFHHIGITVTSPEQTLEFFDDVFGLVTGMVLQV